MSRTETGTSDTTEFQQNLTRERARLRNLHETRTPREEIQYRDHQIIAENSRHLDAYELRDEDGRLLVTGERSEFANADDWVRFFDYAIQQGPDAARDWRDENINGWWSR